MNPGLHLVYCKLSLGSLRSRILWRWPLYKVYTQGVKRDKCHAVFLETKYSIDSMDIIVPFCQELIHCDLWATINYKERTSRYDLTTQWNVGLFCWSFGADQEVLERIRPTISKAKTSEFRSGPNTIYTSLYWRRKHISPGQLHNNLFRNFWNFLSLKITETFNSSSW